MVFSYLWRIILKLPEVMNAKKYKLKRQNKDQKLTIPLEWKV